MIFKHFLVKIQLASKKPAPLPWSLRPGP